MYEANALSTATVAIVEDAATAVDQVVVEDLDDS